MSRSIKKTLKKWVCAGTGMKLWKRAQNRKIRRSALDVPNGNHYRKENDIWLSPSDGKMWFGGDSYYESESWKYKGK